MRERKGEFRQMKQNNLSFPQCAQLSGIDTWLIFMSESRLSIKFHSLNSQAIKPNDNMILLTLIFKWPEMRSRVKKKHTFT